ncbi:hypothetical protein ECDEC10A_1002 [Escherichia coli DEC10A]|nr:hypothetical protein ECDEC10A_1002 [Escherichia coli DEC10A]
MVKLFIRDQKKHGVFRVLPVKGASVYGKPVITMPKTRNQRGVYLCEVGTDTAKRNSLCPYESRSLACG